MLLEILAAGLAGLLVGSFLNVVAWRLPRGESLAHPPSHCPGCGEQIKPWDNVPVVSWLALHGRCRSCKTKISIRYPLVELSTGLLYAAVVAFRSGTIEIVLGLLLVTFLVPISLIDLDRRVIPNKLTLPLAVVSLIAVVAIAPSELLEYLAAGIGGFLFFFLAAFAYPRGMGMGDVKLAGAMGLALGRAVAPAVLFALIGGVAIGAAIIAAKGAHEGRKTAVPFGPFLALGSVIALFVGDSLMDAYLERF
jgi:leader peptidase (prepilin peptidase) / N-methyltransferase